MSLLFFDIIRELIWNVNLKFKKRKEIALKKIHGRIILEIFMLELWIWLHMMWVIISNKYLKFEIDNLRNEEVIVNNNIL
jgi:hypothetical protein